MKRGRYSITNETGLHLRPAGKLCERAAGYEASVMFEHEGSEVNAKSVLSVLAAGVQRGDEIELVCTGADEEEAFRAIADLLTELGAEEL